MGDVVPLRPIRVDRVSHRQFRDYLDEIGRESRLEQERRFQEFLARVFGEAPTGPDECN